MNELLKSYFRPIRRSLTLRPVRTKHEAELGYWSKVLQPQDGPRPPTDGSEYRDRMLRLAGQETADFVSDKIVADFGCGPLGSLCWATSARLRIGIDVLAAEYARFDIRAHNMCYVSSTEDAIPLPPDYVDVLYTMNALDHVWRLEKMCDELIRILAPGGMLVGAFNLDEEPTNCEPQRLTEARLKDVLLNRLKTESYRVVPLGPAGALYLHLWDDAPDPGVGRRFLVVRAIKTAPSLT